LGDGGEHFSGHSAFDYMESAWVARKLAKICPMAKVAIRSFLAVLCESKCRDPNAG
jgi:hypothetical protein